MGKAKSKDKGISKSSFIAGKNCLLALWNRMHDVKRDANITNDNHVWNNSAMRAGNEIGDLAQLYFGGVQKKGNALIKNYISNIAAAQTKKFIEDGSEIIFEACAVHAGDKSNCWLDVLRKVPGTDEWDMIEVKNSGSVKPYHKDDLSFQYYVFKGAGYKIRSCFLMHINGKYERQGDLDLSQLFVLEDITAAVLKKQPEIEAKVKEEYEAAKLPAAPVVDVGGHCTKPLLCPYKSTCWKNIFNEAAAGPAQFNAPMLDQFLKKVEYPVYYLDYEAMMPFVPLYNGTKPFQFIPFQFSLHVEKAAGAPLIHTDFLHTKSSDPRRAFVERLIAVCGTKGSVMVYNDSFERSRNKELGLEFPEYKEQLDAISARMIDLSVPFQKHWIYEPAQKGSLSIKGVVPAYTHLSYSGMGVANGEEAAQAYLAFAQGKLDKTKTEKLWDSLTAYCTLDTLAMVEIHRALRRRVYPVEPVSFKPQP